MTDPAQLTITSGPDRGRVFDLGDEVVHIGHGADNDIDLSDADLSEHQASIVSRNGRYAIFSPEANAVAVDDNAIPPDQWVWLPEEARIRFGERTSVLFATAAVASRAVEGQSDEAAAARSEAQPTSPPPRSAPQRADLGSLDPFGDEAEALEAERDTDTGSGRKKRRRPRSRKRKRSEGTGEKRKVAKFVTDQTGDTLVTLGEDGQLPELNLAEGPRVRRKVEKDPKEGVSVGVYALLVLSMLTSTLLVVMDDGGSRGSSRQQRAEARLEIRANFIGTPDDESPEPYQVLLREALLAHVRGDVDGEREAYREVLVLLGAEDVSPVNGVTGSQARDEILREAIGTVLSR